MCDARGSCVTRVVCAPSGPAPRGWPSGVDCRRRTYVARATAVVPATRPSPDVETAVEKGEMSERPHHSHRPSSPIGPLNEKGLNFAPWAVWGLGCRKKYRLTLQQTLFFVHSRVRMHFLIQHTGSVVLGASGRPRHRPTDSTVIVRRHARARHRHATERDETGVSALTSGPAWVGSRAPSRSRSHADGPRHVAPLAWRAAPLRRSRAPGSPRRGTASTVRTRAPTRRQCRR